MTSPRPAQRTTCVYYCRICRQRPPAELAASLRAQQRLLAGILECGEHAVTMSEAVTS